MNAAERGLQFHYDSRAMTTVISPAIITVDQLHVGYQAFTQHQRSSAKVKPACLMSRYKQTMRRNNGVHPELNRSKNLVLCTTAERSANCFCFVVDNSYRHPSLSTYARFADAPTRLIERRLGTRPAHPRRACRVPSKGHDMTCRLPAVFHW